MLSPSGKKAAVATGVMLLTLFAFGEAPAGNVRLAIFILHLIALGCALWFYASTKGYAGTLALLLLPSLWIGLLVLAWLPDKTANAENPPKPSSTGFKKPLIGAAFLFFADAIWMNQGVLSAILGLAILFVATPMAMFSRERSLRAYKLKKYAIWLTAILSVLVFNWYSNQMAHRRANDVIAAVNAFHQKHGAYPKRLDDLVPAFLPSVPRAKYVLGLSRFKYLYGEANPELYYVSLTPFGRPTYSFQLNKWVHDGS